MSDIIALGNNAASLDISTAFDGFSCVKVTIAEDENEEHQVVTVGNEDGRTLNIDMPMCTDTEQARTAADRILKQLSGLAYQPYTASNAILDPSAEIGDAITINGVYTGIYNVDTNYSSLMTAELTAPQNEDIDHEYQFESRSQRKTSHELEGLKSVLSVQAQQIEAKVSSSGGSSSSFGWSLTSEGFILSSTNKDVLVANSEGVTVDGEIISSKGKIGGFTITSDAIYSGMNSMSSTENGVYIGNNGISLGGGKFKVTSNGNLNATSGKFTGTVYAGSITGGKGTAGGTMSGSYLSGSSVGSSQLSSEVVKALGFAESANSVLTGATVAQNFKTTALSINANSFSLNGRLVEAKHLYDSMGGHCVDASGNWVYCLSRV